MCFIRNLKPLELINYIMDNYFEKFIKKKELEINEHIDDGYFGTVSKDTWKKRKI